MAAPRPPCRLGRIAAGVVIAGAAGGWAAARRPSAGALVVVALVAVALLGAGGLTRRAAATAAGAAALTVVFVAGQVGRPLAVDATAVYASAVAAVVELAFWSAELTVAHPWDTGVTLRRWAALAGMTGGGGGAALIAGAARRAGRGNPGPMFAVGAVAVAAVVAGIVYLTTRACSQVGRAAAAAADDDTGAHR